MVEEILEVPRKAIETTGKAAKMAEMGCGTIMAMDQATSEVCGASSEASDDHIGNVQEVTMLPTMKDKALRRHRPKVMKEKQQATYSLRALDGEACYTMLKKFVPFVFIEELL